MTKETLKEILRTQVPPPVLAGEVPRQLLGSLKPRAQFALVLTGIRRCGKSTLQAQLMRQCDEAGRGAFYCNFDDMRLAGMTPRDLVLWLEVFKEMAPAAAAVFLDEVQEVTGWQRLVRTLLDAGREVCVTGSNASLLGSELGTKLTGRHESHTVWPFSYGEFLQATRLERCGESLERYLADGGFPIYLREQRDAFLNDLVHDVLARDVVVRHKLRETRHARNLLLYLAANSGLPVSLQTLAKNLGIPSADEASRYLEYLQDAYLLHAVPKFSASFKKRVVAPPKYYCVDNGMRRVISPQMTPDLGRRLEAAVALDLLRRGETPAYAAEKDAWECDFVAGDTVYQACWELNAENEERELRGLVAAKAVSRAQRMVVLSVKNASQTLATDTGETVEVLPAWEWLM